MCELIFSLPGKDDTPSFPNRNLCVTIDRLIGLVLSRRRVIIVFAAMLIIAKLGDKASVGADMINASSVAKWFFDNNPFVALL